MPRLPPAADVGFGADGALRSAPFDDVYFSRDGGLEESRLVFLAGCGLPEAWRGRRRYVVGELGFGAGLNLLAVWQAWRTHKPPGGILHFASVEGLPLSAAIASKTLARFPEVADLAAQLLARWPVRALGPQRLWFPEDGLCLTVSIGPVEKAIQDLPGPVDAWFLDGFAPARNPEMWTDAVLAAAVARSRPGARFATYSVAGAVRRGLARAGVDVERAPGFGAKRERLVGRLPGSPPAEPAAPSVAIIGGGVAGACLGHAFRRRRASVRLFEAGAGLAGAASGNPAGLVMPRLDRGAGPAAAFFRAAYLNALDLYTTLTPEAFSPCGVDQRPVSAQAGVAFQDLLADPPLPEDHLASGPSGALAHLKAGVLRPVAAIAALSVGVDVRTDVLVARLDCSGEGWTLLDPQGRGVARVDAVIVATGAALGRLDQTAWMPIQLSRGQIEFAAIPPPGRALTKGGYLAPLPDGVVFGATFDPAPLTAPDPKPDPGSLSANMAQLAALAPEVAACIDATQVQSRAAFRATTADRLPLAGPAPDLSAWRAGHRRPHRGLFVLGGLGARGLTLAPLLAEAIASAVLDEPAPFGADMAQAVCPARFVERAIKRGETLPC